MRPRGKWLLAAGLVLVLVLTWLLVQPRSGRMAPRSERSREAIVVLGLQLHPDDMPRLGLKRRVLKGVELWRASGGSALLVLSGARKEAAGAELGVRPVTEAAAMREIAACAGVPDSALWTEERASNTAENAFFSAQLLREMRGFTQLERVQVVTSDWHLARAMLAFESFVSPRLDLRFVGAPDGGSDERSARDLVLLPATLRDLEAVAPGRLPVAWAAAARFLASRRMGTLWVAPGAGPPPPPSSAFRPCTASEEAAAAGVALLGPAAAGGLSPCAVCPVVFVEAHPRQVARARDAQATRGAPLSSTTWLYRLDCTGVAAVNVAGFACLTVNWENL